MKKIIALLLCISALVGCARSGGERSEEDGADTVRVAVFKNSGERQEYFEKGIALAYDDIKNEYKDGVQGKKLAEFTTDDTICVNTARAAYFKWTIPAEGIDGYSIKAVVKEGKKSGGYYEPVESYSETYEKSPEYEFEYMGVEQVGDDFFFAYKMKKHSQYATIKVVC